MQQLYVKAWVLIVSIVILIAVSSISAFVVITEKESSSLSKQTLSETIQILGQTTSDLSQKNMQVISAQTMISNLTIELYEIISKLQSTNENWNTTKSDLYKIYSSFNNVTSELNTLKSGNRYLLHDPTYNETKVFISNDTTDLNEYVSGVYFCTHFARDVISNATKIGINCAFVLLYYNNSGHAIVCFNTTDKGIIFIEPQNDNEIEIILGQNYSEKEIKNIITIW